jgi:transcription elongation factor Elf1
MAQDDVFGDDEPMHDGEPEPWRPAVRCPKCASDQTRLVTLHYEMSIYVCELCKTRFEIEEEL